MASPGDDRVVIITGSSSGIGAVLSRDFVSKGRYVVGFDVQADLGKALEKELGDHFLHIDCDITSYESQAAAFQKVFDNFGRIDVFCHNAGVIDQSSVYKLDYRGRNEIPPKPNLLSTEVCYQAIVYGTQLAIHFMRKNPTPGGCIVATGSGVATHPLPSMPEYSAAKAAMNAFIRAAGPVLKLKENIRINCVNPGLVPTNQIPNAMLVAYDHIVTPLTTVVEAYNKCLDDQSLSGELLNCCVDRIYFVPIGSFADNNHLRSSTIFYEGFFVGVHGEPSGLPNAVG